MKYTYIIFVFSLFVLSTSCGKFLDVNPKAEVVDKDIFSTSEGCEDALTGLYGELKIANLYGERWNWGVFDVLSQDFSAGLEEYNYLELYNYNDAQKLIDTMWTEAYRVVGYANNVIKNIEARSENQFVLQNIYLGEAYGIRAMLHFDILRAFAPHVELKPNDRGIPYVTDYSFKHTDFSSVSKVYEFLEKDLRKAQELLTEDQNNLVFPRPKDDDIKQSFLKGREMHFNYYAATALLARVLWTKGDYSGARTEALKVITSQKFPLAEKDEITILVAGVLSKKETIWGIYSTDYINITKNRLNSNSSWISNVPYQSGTSKYPKPFTSIYSQYLGDNSGVDSRLNWFRAANDIGETKNCLKIVDRVILESETNTPAKRGLLDGISMLRIPEMYYIVAEAYIRENNSEEAEKYIDKVLLSRGLTTLKSRTPIITPNLDFIYNERHKEMYCEGQRWFDMKKQNEDIVSNATRLTIPASDRVYVLPIPLAEFENRNQ